MFCNRCGAQIPDDARFCQNCGAPVTGQFQVRQSLRGVGSNMKKSGRKLGISARPEARIFGIPVSGKTALIVIAAVVILVIIANKIGG